MNMYNTCRVKFLSNKDFIKIINNNEDLKRSFFALETMSKCFIINGNNIKVNIKIEFNTNDGDTSHTNLLLDTIVRIGDNNIYKHNTMEHMMDINELFNITITLANTSPLIFNTKKYKNTTEYIMQKSYIGTFGIMKFIEEHLLNYNDNYMVLKFQYHIVGLNYDNNQYLKFYARVYGIPLLVNKMTLINI